jgi:hypothetical protein
MHRTPSIPYIVAYYVRDDSQLACHLHSLPACSCVVNGSSRLNALNLQVQ